MVTECLNDNLKAVWIQRYVKYLNFLRIIVARYYYEFILENPNRKHNFSVLLLNMCTFTYLAWQKTLHYSQVISCSNQNVPFTKWLCIIFYNNDSINEINIIIERKLKLGIIIMCAMFTQLLWMFLLDINNLMFVTVIMVTSLVGKLALKEKESVI